MHSAPIPKLFVFIILMSLGIVNKSFDKIQMFNIIGFYFAQCTARWMFACHRHGVFATASPRLVPSCQEEQRCLYKLRNLCKQLFLRQLGKPLYLGKPLHLGKRSPWQQLQELRRNQGPPFLKEEVAAAPIPEQLWAALLAAEFLWFWSLLV